MSLISFGNEKIITCDTQCSPLLAALDCSADIQQQIEELVQSDGEDTIFAIVNGLLDHRLMQSQPIPIAHMNNVITSKPGVYSIFHQNNLVYIGSSDDVKSRLREHRRKIEEASKLDIHDCYCKFIVCQRMISLSCESQLINYYAPKWNRSGFGSKNSALFTQCPWNLLYGRSVPLLDNALRLRNTIQIT